MSQTHWIRIPGGNEFITLFVRASDVQGYVVPAGTEVFIREVHSVMAPYGTLRTSIVL